VSGLVRLGQCRLTELKDAARSDISCVNAPGADDASVSTAGYRDAVTSCAVGPLRTASPDQPASRRGRRTPPQGVVARPEFDGSGRVFKEDTQLGR
jgi:hypothetical protein